MKVKCFSEREEETLEVYGIYESEGDWLLYISARDDEAIGAVMLKDCEIVDSSLKDYKITMTDCGYIILKDFIVDKNLLDLLVEYDPDACKVLEDYKKRFL